jgi:putative two-component system response regulator
VLAARSLGKAVTGSVTGVLAWGPCSTLRNTGGTRMIHFPARHILLIDDEAFTAQVVRAALSRSQFELSYVNSAQDALPLVLDNPPDLVLLDVLMPGLSSLDFCTLLRNTPETQQIPVVFLSGAEAPELNDIMHKTKVRGYIQKPIQMEAFQWQVEAFIMQAALQPMAKVL